jgi:hypothetical protein
MYIELDPQIEAVFKASTAVSGKSLFHSTMLTLIPELFSFL